MNITFNYSGGDQCSQYCVTPEKLSGTSVDIEGEMEAAYQGNGRIVKAVPCDRPVLVDTCWGRDTLKVANSNCQFFVPSNETELMEVTPVLEGLMQRQVFVLQNIDRADMATVQFLCRQSFYHVDGRLINSRFGRDNLSPSKMAEAGFMFVGDANRDLVSCYLNPRHTVRQWEDSDEPVSEHIKHYGTLCSERKKYEIPLLTTRTGSDVTGEKFRLIMPKKCDVPFGNYCEKATLVTHTDYPIKRTSFQSIAWAVDSTKLEQIEKTLRSKQGAREIDSEYSDLHQQRIKLLNFSSMLREFKQQNQNYIELLNHYKTSSHLGESAVVDAILSVLSSGSVEQEIDRTVEHLATHEVLKSFPSLLGVFPVNIQVSGTHAISCIIAENIARHASAYSDRFFVDDSLNSLVSSGQLGTVLSEGYFTAHKRDEKLMGLLEQGAVLTASLVSISEKIHELMNPFIGVGKWPE